ncbi:UbiH/UbiF/VisC/COQ6 family ubiquinone biosynthesis hydroxylase [Kordiimonas lacus]|uniref:2-octaprenyl-6-methoxyphenol hydroxylase n=1 Tax=Kordiimonas lacus TaxID=637679 RepID=A0A1G6TJC5_9PROT|nr:UbiH/UbiF/VisC/COQ6 family ubiquinone biosynthesis hydroxylase [Kordiimonas lacus]SDD29141.1 2-octaprenyl-6-methoxyphenol hydroxylase [Kordiimonas lacus]
MSDKKLETDITIIGGGLAGMTAAIGLAEHGFEVAVVDMAPQGDLTAAGYDGRASALAFASCQLFEALGIWKHMEPYAQPILEIRVSDGPSLLSLHFDHETLGDGPLGHMVENRHTRIALFERLKEIKGVTLLAPERVAEIDRTKEGVTTTLTSGTVIKSDLIIGADGRGSLVRQHAGIPVSVIDYKQHGIVCSVEHEFSHCGIAHERFLPSGPFAILPLCGNRSSLVWTEKSHLTDTIMGLSDRAFESEVRRRIGDFLGEVKVIGGRWAYPLTLQYGQDYVADRLALIGDAAHGIHPISGQGLNLGLKDVAALIETLVDARRVGLDIGAMSVLENYGRWRTTDNASVYAITDGFNRLFSNDIAPIKLLRDVGMAAVDQVVPLKNFFMQHARGTVGDLPKLLRGEQL